MKEKWYIKAKRLLKKRNITMAQLGEALDVKKSGISQKLSGQRGVTVDELMIIAGMLNTNLDELCKDDPDYTVNSQELEFMEALRAASPEKRQMIITMMQSLLKE